MAGCMQVLSALLAMPLTFLFHHRPHATTPSCTGAYALLWKLRLRHHANEGHCEASRLHGMRKSHARCICAYNHVVCRYPSSVFTFGKVSLLVSANED